MPSASDDAPARAPRTLLVLGPTAGGKTALGIALAQRLPGGGEVVSADSMQVYRGMDIGTAKPSVEERAGVPHHLIDIADPHAGAFTVADWLDAAREAIAQIHARGRHAIVVGGTNLYIKALVEGMFEGPPSDPALRAQLDALPTEILRGDLEHHDPVAAARIHPNDRRRTIRALEVWMRTGQRISELQAQWSERPRELPAGWAVVGLEWPVELLNRRINARVHAMVDAGLLREVVALAGRGPLTRQAVEAVGYHEMLEHLAGTLTLEQAVERMKIRSRQYGKQQRTWLRRFRAIPGSVWIEAARATTEGAADEVIEKLFP
ncbi:MAG: tRNA (adenosine(37)-N6)-dimethylallyltransferase MiaA [Phycisphaerales bacterium]